MRIGFCDDEPEARKQAIAICRQVMEEEGLPWEPVEFASGQEVLDYKGRLDLLLLDMEMPGLGGVAVKERLEAAGVETGIVYLTSHQEWMKEAFGRNVIAFAEKRKIHWELLKYLKEAIRKWNENIVLDNGISSREILYIVAENGYERAYLADGREMLQFRMGIKVLEQKLLPAGFLKIHRGCLVNLHYVDSIKNHVVYIGETQLPVAVRLRTEVKRQYEDFCRKHAGYYG